MVNNSREDSIEVHVLKSQTPIVWLDTSIISNIVKHKLSDGKHSHDAISRAVNIYSLIYDKVTAGKLISPIADQMDELLLIDCDDYDDFIRESEHVLASVAQNRKFLSNMDIKYGQLSGMMKVYIEGQSELILKSGDFINSTYSARYDYLSKEYRQDSKNQTVEAFEELRVVKVKDEVNFKEELRLEYGGLVDVLTNPKYDHYSSAENIRMYLNQIWKYNGGTSFDELVKFANSKYYQIIPYFDISSYFYAQKLIQKGAVESGDIFDESHLAAMIPLCDIVITDKKMSNMMKQKGFDEKYKTEIYSLSDYTQIISTLENL